jgi:acetyl-CoA carboxylase biotin carboxylase subunit
MFASVLIANRGEIAVRIARTCRELDIEVIAVCSTEDRDSAVTRLADRTVLIGPAEARRSYSYPPALIEAALATGAEAIHPGYGFLSEDPDFAEICAANDITFVGPPPRLMAQLGDKATARAVMAEAGLPVLPGTGALVDVDVAIAAAADIGYPVIVKAVAGGGGKGMAIAHDSAGLAVVFTTASASAQLLFGDARVYLERLVEGARHVEVQVLRDAAGNAVHVGERDCSVQRRYQKLIEETPAPALPGALATTLGEAAVRGAHAVGYRGAGTFEFLVDDVGRHYFMEINCRIQVEHPVTEMVTGIDLVREQLIIASGEPISVRQQDIRPRGVALEARINIEDPDRGFAPTPGVLTALDLPGGPFVRVDTHGFVGARISPAYDSLLAKVVVWAPDRYQAMARMDRALGEVRVEGPGIRSTTGFLRDVLAHPSFRDGKYTTALVEQILAGRG